MTSLTYLSFPSNALELKSSNQLNQQNQQKQHPIHQQVIVFLHGLGASAHDFIDFPNLFQIPKTLYIFPQAPNRPVTINKNMMMSAWYDIKSLSLEREVDQNTIRESVQLLNDLLTKVEDLGIPANRIFLGGFSQGGAMALEVGLRYPKKLAGIISLSAYLLNDDHIKKVSEKEEDVPHVQQDTPVFIAHGEKDGVVPFVLGKAAAGLLNQKQFKLEWYHDSYLDHGINARELEAVKGWLLKHVLIKNQ